jgi:glycosyltransferase involved in cell wall biosynthesis
MEDDPISVVINTFNEGANIERAIKSVSFASEIIVCDMYSTDRTVEIAQKLGAKVVYHKYTRIVEPARNFAISKAKHQWILVLDADEAVPPKLARHLKEITNKDLLSSFVHIPRKNIIFGKWMKASGWWPDYHIRFFKSGAVVWHDAIHSKPTTNGVGVTLPLDEDLAIIHYHYSGVFQFIERMNRYTTIQAEELYKSKAVFHAKDLIKKPLGEFLSRYFANEGYRDGLHGFSLALLQAVSFLVVYLKLWEMRNFADQRFTIEDLKTLTTESGSEVKYWLKFITLSKNPVKRFIQKIRN